MRRSREFQTGLDDVVAAALPTAGGAGLALVDLLEPLADTTVLIVGAGGGVGSFATQFAANAGASVIANVRDDDAERMRALRRHRDDRSHEGRAPGARCDKRTRTASMSSSTS